MKKIGITIFVLLALPAMTAFATVDPEPVVVIENTQGLCSDGVDNDGNGTSDLLDASCAAFIPVVIIENSAELCSDGVDNDGNGTSDLLDPTCAPFIPVVVIENTAELCTDGVDNDGNGTSDFLDPTCAPFMPVASSTPETPVNGGGAGNGGFPTGGSTGGSGTTLTTGTPVSATASTTITTFDTTGINLMCSNLIVNYAGINKKNVKSEVIKLQAFLNAELGLHLAVDGKFGPATLAAVKAFQLKYATSVLLPWDQAGLSVNLVNRPTGYVYKTTLRQINLLQCPSLDIPMPKLP